MEEKETKLFSTDEYKWVDYYRGYEWDDIVRQFTALPDKETQTYPTRIEAFLKAFNVKSQHKNLIIEILNKPKKERTDQENMFLRSYITKPKKIRPKIKLKKQEDDTFTYIYAFLDQI